MRKLWRPAALILALTVGLGLATYAAAGGGKKDLKADTMSGYQENIDVSTVASGSFKIKIDDDAQTFTYTLSYADLEGTVTQSHIHFGKRALNGGITIWLCQTAASPAPAAAAAAPQCPAAPGGTVTRTVTAAEILAPGTQGIEAMNFDELAEAMRAGHTYANVHSTKWPGGEIRAQINDKNDHHDE